jgi:hypothetical protein
MKQSFQDTPDQAHLGGMPSRLDNSTEGAAEPSLVSRAVKSYGLINDRNTWVWEAKSKRL